MVVGSIALIVVLVGGYFIAKAVKHSMTPVPTVHTQMAQHTGSVKETSPTASSVTTAGQAFTVEGNEYAFSPATLTVKNNQPVTILFKNTGKYPHNFSISELDVKSKTIRTGQEDTVTFTPTKTGSFEYVCTVPGHADRGMKGTLLVQ